MNFDKEVQVKTKINRLKAKDEELGCRLLRNRHLRRPDRDSEEEIIDELDELIREKVNELKNLFATDNGLIDWLLWLNEIIKDFKTGLKHCRCVRNKYSRFRIM